MEKIRSYRWLMILALAAGLAACGGKAYLYEPADSGSLLAAGETQSEGPIEVAASVPGREETERIFGIDLYDQGIQPVWLQIENSSDTIVRYAPVSTDPEYYAPLEVAYMNRRGYSDEEREAMNARFHSLAMPRYIEPGESRSGFVFTNADPGAKGFNVDVFGGGKAYGFTFLLRVPGFEPDYASIDIDSLYADEEIVDYEVDALQEPIRNLPCCSTDQRGEESSEPLNLVLVGQGEKLVRALLRSGWRETSIEEAAGLTPQFLFGRQQDAIFRYETIGGDGFYELRFWKAPFRSGAHEVYVGQARHFYRLIGSVTRLDADVDNARNFAIQKLLYGQAISEIAWVTGKEVVPASSFWDTLIRPTYFSDGYRIVLWLSAEPVSMFDMEIRRWDIPPKWLQQ
jgi:predicted small lipoprotein YifL